MTLHLLKSAQLYAPEPRGQQDILVCNGKILSISEHIHLSGNIPVTTFDCEGAIACPGFVDPLTHITGGGGEGSFKTRTPEMSFSDAILGGVTTVAGALGTDAICRTHVDLIAKTKALNEEGLSAYFYTGNYHFPVITVTGSVQKDIMLLSECIGIGELAISDHRGSPVSAHELASVAAQARVGGMCSGKSGIVLIHVGDGERKLQPLFDAASVSDIPLHQFYPTHVNRHRDLLDDGFRFIQAGGTIDLTASMDNTSNSDDIACADALSEALSKDIDTHRITFSTDGHASLPEFNEHGELTHLGVGSMQSLHAALKCAVLLADIPLEIALRPVTQNPAHILKLKHKGQIHPGMDADLLVMTESNLSLHGVMANGHWCMQHGELLRKGTFE